MGQQYQQNMNTENNNSYDDRFSKLEQSILDITQNQKEIQSTIQNQSNSIVEIRKQLQELQDEFQDIDKKSTINESRIDSINEFIEEINSNLENVDVKANQLESDIDKRLKTIENRLDIDSIEVAKSLKPSACELEQLTTVPEEYRLQQFTVRVTRAIALYEHFHDIAEPVKGGGKRLLSKDIKTFLNGYTDATIAYVQVQRVIDSFLEKTNDEYTSIQTDNGRAIVWKPNK